jgi:hypothetical protein
MSTTEILAALPNLSSKDLQAVWREAGLLLEGQTMSASVQLLAGIYRGDASFAREAPITLDEARRTVRSWITK